MPSPLTAPGRPSKGLGAAVGAGLVASVTPTLSRSGGDGGSGARRGGRREVLLDQRGRLRLHRQAAQGGGHGVQGPAYAGHAVTRVTSPDQTAPQLLVGRVEPESGLRRRCGTARVVVAAEQVDQ